MLQASNSEYQAAFKELLRQATKSKAIVFIFQDNLDGIYSMRHWQSHKPMTVQELEGILENKGEEEYEYIRNRDYIENAILRLKDYESRKSEVENLITHICESDVEVAPFYVRSDVTIRLQEFLSDVEQGVFLRLFVPNDRLQAEQLKSLLSVLERYLRQIEGQNFSIDSRKSDKGIVYIFRSDADLSSVQNLNDAILRFDTFMKMCGDNPGQALEILKFQGLSDYDSAFFVEKYSRDYKRLILESRHEFERKSLLLKHQLEADIIDLSCQPTLSMPNESVSNLISAVATGGNVSINIGNMSIVNSEKVQNEIDKVINGSIEYNDNDKLLFNLFSQYADGLEALQCRSDLDQLKDTTVAKPERQNAKQRLTGFLRKSVKKAGEITEKIAVEALSLYLESLLKGNM